MQINVKMPTTVGILTFISMIHFMLSLVENGDSVSQRYGAISTTEIQDYQGTVCTQRLSVPKRSETVRTLEIPDCQDHRYTGKIWDCQYHKNV